MKKQLFFIVFLLVLICAVPVFAQKDDKAKPDLSGTWVLDASKNSNMGFAVLKMSSKSANSVKKLTNQIIIEHAEPEIKINEKIVAEEFDAAGNSLQKREIVSPVATFYTDNRGEQNESEDNPTKISTTKWDGRTILITYFNEGKEQLSTVKLSLGKDGQELKVWTRSFQFQDAGNANFLSSMFGNNEIVYKKKQ